MRFWFLLERVFLKSRYENRDRIIKICNSVGEKKGLTASHELLEMLLPPSFESYFFITAFGFFKSKKVFS